MLERILTTTVAGLILAALIVFGIESVQGHEMQVGDAVLT